MVAPKPKSGAVHGKIPGVRLKELLRFGSPRSAVACSGWGSRCMCLFKVPKIGVCNGMPPNGRCKKGNASSPVDGMAHVIFKQYTVMRHSGIGKCFGASFVVHSSTGRSALYKLCGTQWYWERLCASFVVHSGTGNVFVQAL